MSILDFLDERKSDNPSHIINDNKIRITNHDDIEELFELCYINEQEIKEVFDDSESFILTFKVDVSDDKKVICKAIQRHIKHITYHTDDVLDVNVSFTPEFIIKFPKLKCSVKDMDDISISLTNMIDELDLPVIIDRSIYTSGVSLYNGDSIDIEENEEEGRFISIHPELNTNPDEIYEIEFKYHIESTDIDECESLLNIIFESGNVIDMDMIGQILFNINHGKQRGSYLWEKYGGEGWKDNITKETNKVLTYNNYGKRTLRIIAKSCNKVEYKRWMKEYLKFYVSRCLRPTSSYRSVAILLYKMYMERFICESVKYQEWYEFKGTFFDKLDDAVVMRNLLSNKIRKLFEGFYGTEVQEEAYKILKNLETPAYKTNVIKEASELFYVKDFNRIKDTKLDLFAFKNVVYDCERERIRPGYPDDLITLCAGVEYKEYDLESASVKKLNKYFKQVFVNKKLRDYFLLSVSSCLRGRNREKNFYVMSGIKSYNGKSTTQSMIELGFGEYSCKPPTSLITAAKRTDPNSASPALEILRNKRIGFLQEPSSNETINSGVMKELSSGFDSVYSRALHSMPISFVPQLRMYLVCNAIPSIQMENAIKNRMKIIDFMSEFSNNAPEDEKEQYEQMKFPMDTNFEKNFDELVPVLMWKLIKIFPRYKEQGLIPPPECNLSLDTFEQINDPLGMFLDETVEKKEGKQMKLKTLYATYVNWYRMLNINKKLIPYESFSHSLSKHNIYVDTEVKPYVIKDIKLIR